MSKYLVTGGAGFIGSNLVKKILADGDNEVIVVDDLSMGKKANLDLQNQRITFYQKSITDMKFMSELLINEKFDYLALLGAVASVADSVDNPYQTHLINQEANINIYETIRTQALKPAKILFASSAAVYGNTDYYPTKEGNPINPITPYGLDKYASERYGLIYHELYGLPVVVTRCFNVYGPKQNPSSPYSGVLSIMYRCFLENKQFTVFGDGEQLRDFTYVDDVTDAMMLLLTSKTTGVYNVGTGNTETLNEVIEAFEKAMGKKLTVKYVDARVGDIKKSAADISKLELLGYHSKYNIEAGLKAYIKHSK